MTDRLELDVVVTRGGIGESVHRVSAAVVRTDRLIARAGDPHLHTFWRSAAKPFQSLPFVRDGGLDALGWGPDELAVACASHGGEPEHVAIVERMLAALGLEEGDLACGIHDPLAARGVRILRECGARPTRLHNNCSGKHTAMLARALQSGWPAAGYHVAEHPVQQAILSEIAGWSGMSRDEISLSVDGCGVTVFGLSLRAMATAYARLSEARRAGVPEVARIIDAMTSNPFLVGGTDRFDTVLMEEAPGIVCKVGAEGVHCAAILDRGIGIALKVEDGAPRAQYPALLAVLEHFDALPSPLPARLADIANKPVRNTRHEVVGEIHVRPSA